jgi:hypothetical protein
MLLVLGMVRGTRWTKARAHERTQHALEICHYSVRVTISGSPAAISRTISWCGRADGLSDKDRTFWAMCDMLLDVCLFGIRVRVLFPRAVVEQAMESRRGAWVALGAQSRPRVAIRGYLKSHIRRGLGE